MTSPQTELKRMQSRKASFRGMMDYKNEMEIGTRNIFQHKNAKGTFAKKIFRDSLDKANITGITKVSVEHLTESMLKSNS